MLALEIGGMFLYTYVSILSIFSIFWYYSRTWLPFFTWYHYYPMALGAGAFLAKIWTGERDLIALYLICGVGGMITNLIYVIEVCQQLVQTNGIIPLFEGETLFPPTRNVTQLVARPLNYYVGRLCEDRFVCPTMFLLINFCFACVNFFICLFFIGWGIKDLMRHRKGVKADKLEKETETTDEHPKGELIIPTDESKMTPLEKVVRGICALGVIMMLAEMLFFIVIYAQASILMNPFQNQYVYLAVLLPLGIFPFTDVQWRSFTFLFGLAISSGFSVYTMAVTATWRQENSLPQICTSQSVFDNVQTLYYMKDPSGQFFQTITIETLPTMSGLFSCIDDWFSMFFTIMNLLLVFLACGLIATKDPELRKPSPSLPPQQQTSTPTPPKGGRFAGLFTKRKTRQFLGETQ